LRKAGLEVFDDFGSDDVGDRDLMLSTNFRFRQPLRSSSIGTQSPGPRS
jgi:hypothetical protein